MFIPPPQIVSQGQRSTSVVVYGTDVTVTLVSCPPGQSDPCYQATLPGYTFTDTNVNADKNAFVNLVTLAINKGIIRPNMVKGTNSV